MKVTVVLWIPNPFLLQVTKKNQTFSKWHCKTSEIWPKISIKENFCKRTVRRKAVLLWEISCQAVFVCESCYGSTKSTKYRRFDGANYSTRLHFSVNSNVVPKLPTLFLPTVKITRGGEQENVFFFCQFTTILTWVNLFMLWNNDGNFFQNSFKMSHFRIFV